MPFDQLNTAKYEDEVLTQADVITFIKEQVREGLKSASPITSSKGWSMLQIMDEVGAKYGDNMRVFARKYILEVVCGINE